MAYADLLTIQTLNTGDVLTAACMTQARDNDEFHIDPPACSFYNSSAQSVADATTTTLTGNSENFDNDSMHSTVTNTGRMTIQTAGRFLFFAAVGFAADADGTRQVLFRVDGTTDVAGQLLPTAGAGNSTGITCARAIGPLTAGQYVEVRVRHTAGGALDVTLQEFAAFFMTR